MKFSIGDYVMVDDIGAHFLTGKCRIIDIYLTDDDRGLEYTEYKVVGAQRGNPKGLPLTQRLIESEMTKI